MSRALTKALSAVEEAERNRDRWVAALATAEAEAAMALDFEVSDPSELEAAGEQAARAAAKAAAARRALGVAEQRLQEAREAALLAEAADEDAAAAALEKEHRSLQSRVDALLKQLEDLNGVRYDLPDGEAIYRRVEMGERVVVHEPRTHRLAVEARSHRVRASVLRATARTRRVPMFFHELDERFGFWASSLISAEDKPESALVYAALFEPHTDDDAAPADDVAAA